MKRDNHCKDLAAIARTYAMVGQYGEAKKTLNGCQAGTASGVNMWRLYAYSMILIEYAGESRPEFRSKMAAKIPAALSVNYKVSTPF